MNYDKRVGVRGVRGLRELFVAKGKSGLRQNMPSLQLALAAKAFSTLPRKAETPDPFTTHGLPIPGAYFKNKESQQPATVAISKSGKRVGEQKQPMSKAAKKRTKHAR